MAKIIQFPGKFKNKKVRKVTKAIPTLSSLVLTPFTWLKFPNPPALYADFNGKLLDKILVNFADYDPPPPTCA